MKRVFNFGAGPATLPESVVYRIQNELPNHHGSGMSVMEMSHRSAEFEAIFERAERDLRDVLKIPSSYTVLFLQGGASLQFSMIPLNLAKVGPIEIVHTGVWSQKASEEAEKIAEVRCVASGEKDRFLRLPELLNLVFDPQAAYLHYVSNNTIYGTQFHPLCPVHHPTLVCDMSSDILSRPVDIERFGLIFAGAQKNMGIAGLTVVIVRNDLLERSSKLLPTMLNYHAMAQHHSLYNTAPTFAIYVAGLVFEWIKEEGGVEAMARINEAKATKLYQCLDQSSLFKNLVHPPDRSWMNVTFTTGDERLDEAFIEFAHQRGLVQLKGHRLLKGMRASLYNAMPMQGVTALIEALQVFEQNQVNRT